MSSTEPEGLGWVKDQIASANRETQEGLKQIALALAKRDDNFASSLREIEKKVDAVGHEMQMFGRDVKRNSRILEPDEGQSLETRVTLLEEHIKQNAVKWNWALGLITSGVAGVVGLLANEAWKFIAHGAGK